MTSTTITLRIGVRWWLRKVLVLLVIVHHFTGRRLSEAALGRLIDKGLYIGPTKAAS